MKKNTTNFFNEMKQTAVEWLTQQVKTPQEGRITSWNEKFIFVDYDNTGRGQATRLEDLKFVNS